MRSVCGGTPASSATTLLLKTPRSSSRSTPPAISAPPQAGPRRRLGRLGQLLHQLLLFPRQLARNVDDDRRGQVAVAAALLRRTLAAHAERLAGRRAGGYLERHGLAERRHVYVCAERRFR